MTDAGRGWAYAAFLLVVAGSFLIIFNAGRRRLSESEYFAAGRSVSAGRNALALLGEMSAASVLGTAALVFTSGFDALYSVIGIVSGWALILLLMARRLRAMGNRTLGDVLSVRFAHPQVRVLIAVSVLGVAVPHILSQFVAAGLLIETLFGLPYAAGLFLFGILACACVVFGGMVAATRIQVIKAVLLLTGIGVTLVLSLLAFRFSVPAMFKAAVAAHPSGNNFLRPGLLTHGLFDTLSYVLTLSLGAAGLPHILSRFFTVTDAKAAQRSAGLALTGILIVNWAVILIGVAAISLLKRPPYVGVDGELVGGPNMAFVHMSRLLGGDAFFGFVSGVLLMTILAAVSAVLLVASAAVAIDLFAYRKVRAGAARPDNVMRSRRATLGLCVIAMLFALAAKSSNIALLATIAHASAATVNFPLLILAMYWNGLTRRGVVVAGWCGFLVAAVLVVLGPLVWRDMLGFDHALFAPHYPTLISTPLTFALAYMVSSWERRVQSRHGPESEPLPSA